MNLKNENMTQCDLCFEKQVAVSFDINIILHIAVGAAKQTLIYMVSTSFVGF